MGRRRWRRRTMRGLTIVGALLVGLVLATVLGAGRQHHEARARARPRALASAHRPHSRPARPSAAASLQSRRQAAAVSAVLRYTPLVRAGTARRREIALTFDDGPSPFTPKIVDTLSRLHAPATFFIVGQQLNTFPAGLPDELRHSFVVGDHTENHAWLGALGPSGQYAQISAAALKANRLGAPAPRLFRPPYGVYNRATIAVLRKLRMLMVLWSVDTGDWRRPGTRAIVSRALTGARPGGIILLHDGGGDRSQTVAALPAIINGLRRRGYQLVSVPHLLSVDPPPRPKRIPHLAGG